MEKNIAVPKLDLLLKERISFPREADSFLKSVPQFGKEPKLVTAVSLPKNIPIYPNIRFHMFSVKLHLV